jgi:hypothetical protein
MPNLLKVSGAVSIPNQDGNEEFSDPNLNSVMLSKLTSVGKQFEVYGIEHIEDLHAPALQSINGAEGVPEIVTKKSKAYDEKMDQVVYTMVTLNKILI